MEIQIKTNASGELYLEDDTGRIARLYRFREALALARISAATYYTWVKRGLIVDVRLRDKGHWRLFTEPELKALIQVGRNLQAEAAGWQVPRPDRTTYESANGSPKWRESP